MIAVFKILTSKENASDEAFSLLVIIPAGELDGRQDKNTSQCVFEPIIPAGELDGLQGSKLLRWTFTELCNFCDQVSDIRCNFCD